MTEYIVPMAVSAFFALAQKGQVERLYITHGFILIWRSLWH